MNFQQLQLARWRLILAELKSSAAGLVDNERERQIAHSNGHSDKTKHKKCPQNIYIRDG